MRLPPQPSRSSSSLCNVPSTLPRSFWYGTFLEIADESATDALPRDVMVYADEFGNLGAIPEMTT